MIEVRSDRGVSGRARKLLAVDGRDRPKCDDARLLHGALLELQRELGPADADAFLRDGLLRNADERYQEYVAHHMVDVPGGSFVMGTAPVNRRHFCGEVPAHTVRLTPFEMARVAVTNEMYALLYPDRAPTAEQDRHKPAVGVTWFEAALLALWMGCRLPTEAEWEFSCGAGADDWCCVDERELHHYAWYCRNSDDELHPVGLRQPNHYGLHDMHGNVWEWCADTYDQDYYARSPERDPLNVSPPADPGLEIKPHKVCRGGSMKSLSEMCRSRYRFHEPPDFGASDLGCRFARSRQLDIEGPFAWLR